MKHIRLIAVDDGMDVTPGLVLKGTEMVEGIYGDRLGGLLAHDLLEHQNGPAAIGGTVDELEALGGMWQVRGRQGALVSMMYSPEQMVAHDISNMVTEIDGSGYWPGHTIVPRSRVHDYDEDFNSIIDFARLEISKLDEETLADFDVDAYLDDALHSMRRGFRKAQRRFGCGYEGCSLYAAVKNAVGSVRPEFEGQEFILSYGRGEARCREVWGRD